MKTTDHERTFDAAVRSRLEDETWDLRVARGVLRKRRRRLVLSAAATAASLAAAASLVFTLTTATLNGSPEGAALNSFVNAQVRGTWQNVYTLSDSARTDEALLVDAELDESLDAVIDDALSRRL
jgi:hypothetical protein